MMKASELIVLSEKQKEAIKYVGKGKIIFYGGARGGGKSFLSHVAANFACYKYPKLRAVIIRETYPELEDVFISYQEERFPPDMFKYKLVEKKNICEFENGSRLLFKALDSPRAARKIMGSQFQFMVVDEANNYTEQTLKKLIGSVRKTDANINFSPTVLMTGNPGGVSDFYFKTRFVNPDYNHWEKGELNQKDRYVFIKALVYDNPYIEQDYIDMLDTLPEELRQAWLLGNWTSFEGQFFAEFNPNVHVIPTQEIPSDWYKVMGFDLGYTKQHPSVALCVAQNPETNDLIVFDEYVNYGTTEQYITDLKAYLDKHGINIIYCDPSMWNEKRDRNDDKSPAFMFLEAGLPVVQANNKRVNGWRILKQWLSWTTHRKPKLLIMDVCSYLIQTLPLNRYNISSIKSKEDCDTNGPDDAADALRYAVVTGFGYPITQVIEENINMIQEKIPEKSYNPMKRFKALYNELYDYRLTDDNIINTRRIIKTHAHY